MLTCDGGIDRSWDLHFCNLRRADTPRCIRVESFPASDLSTSARKTKSLGTVPASVLPRIVPAPTAESMAAGWLNQRRNGSRTGYLHNLFDRIQRVFNQRE
jgi:hypothetical protein